MGLRLTLHNGSRVLLDVPLTNEEWPEETRNLITRELDAIDSDMDDICEICDFFSNRRRLQMVSHMVRDVGNSASFTDLLRVAVNPKYVSDLVNRSPRQGLVVKDAKGYRMSPSGLGSFLLLSLGTKKVLKELDAINSGDKSFEEERPDKIKVRSSLRSAGQYSPRADYNDSSKVLE